MSWWINSPNGVKGIPCPVRQPRLLLRPLWKFCFCFAAAQGTSIWTPYHEQVERYNRENLYAKICTISANKLGDFKTCEKVHRKIVEQVCSKKRPMVLHHNTLQPAWSAHPKWVKKVCAWLREGLAFERRG